MSDENAATVTDIDQDEGEGRQRSSIGFPYNNLDDAIEVAQAIHAHVGTGECDDPQLSAWMSLSPKSSGFRMQLSAARMFGLIETTSGRHKLMSLGRQIVDPQRQRGGRASAFLRVPLYKAIFENFKTGVLPPAAALEREFVQLGVAEKQTGRARQVFERSAEQAGYFEHGKNRLVLPGFAEKDDPDVDKSKDDPDKGGGKKDGDRGNGDGRTPPHPDPIIQGLLSRLPKAGEVWPDAQRKLWLELLSGSFKLIYKDQENNDGGTNA
jgi:hypothetical protein